MLDLWKKNYDKPKQHIKKQRHQFDNKCPSSRSYGFSVVMYWCESWTIKKPEHWRIDAFELWCWRRLLRVPWTTRRSNQSILKEINPEYSLEGLMLKFQYFSYLMWKEDSLEKTLMLGKTERENRVTEDEMFGWHHQLKGHEFEQTPGDCEGLACCSPWGLKELDTTVWLNNKIYSTASLNTCQVWIRTSIFRSLSQYITSILGPHEQYYFVLTSLISRASRGTSKCGPLDSMISISPCISTCFCAFYVPKCGSTLWQTPLKSY